MKSYSYRPKSNDEYLKILKLLLLLQYHHWMSNLPGVIHRASTCNQYIVFLNGTKQVKVSSEHSPKWDGEFLQTCETVKEFMNRLSENHVRIVNGAYDDEE